MTINKHSIKAENAYWPASQRPSPYSESQLLKDYGPYEAGLILWFTWRRRNLASTTFIQIKFLILRVFWNIVVLTEFWYSCPKFVHFWRAGFKTCKWNRIPIFSIMCNECKTTPLDKNLTSRYYEKSQSVMLLKLYKEGYFLIKQ